MRAFAHRNSVSLLRQMYLLLLGNGFLIYV